MSLVKVAIHGVPRSGTTWLGSIFDSSPNVIYRNQPLFSYAFKSYLSEHSLVQHLGVGQYRQEKSVGFRRGLLLEGCTSRGYRSCLLHR